MRFFTPEDDGIAKPWRTDGLIYINPPYGNGAPKRRRKTKARKRRPAARKPWQHSVLEWALKVVNEALEGGEIVWLGPGRTDTEWFDVLSRHASARCEWKGRLIFKGSKCGAPFPSTLFYFGDRPWLFCHLFAPHGRVEVLRARR